MTCGRYTGRTKIDVPVEGTGRVHVPIPIGPHREMWVTCADLYAPADNSGTVWVGWDGCRSTTKSEAAIELQPGSVATLMSPKKGRDDNPEPFDLHDVMMSGQNDGDALMYFTW
jgi:hypothetical protein